MKIATFNINDVNKRLGNLLAWLEQAAPDVVCLQELKCEQKRFPIQSFRKVGYEWLGRARELGTVLRSWPRAPSRS